MNLKYRVAFAFSGLSCWFAFCSIEASASWDDNYVERPGIEGNGNHVIGPNFILDPDLTDKGNAKGMFLQFAMPLADSKIFRGDDKTLNPKKTGTQREKDFCLHSSSLQRRKQGPDFGHARWTEQFESRPQRAGQFDDID